MMNRKGKLRVYRSDYPEELLKLMAKGWFNTQVWAKWGISEKTFYNWLNDNEALQQAYEEGLVAHEAWLLAKGVKALDGEIKGFSFNTWIAMLNNKHKWAKNSVQDQKLVSQTVNINNMNVLQQKGKDGLIEYIKRIGDKNKDILDVEFTENETQLPIEVLQLPDSNEPNNTSGGMNGPD